MTNIEVAGKSYKEIQAMYTEVTGKNAVGKKRADIEAELIAIELAPITVPDTTPEELDTGKPVFGEKRGKAHSTTDAEYMSASARIRRMWDMGEKQAVIAETLKVRPQMVSNVVRAYKQKLADELEEAEALELEPEERYESDEE